MPRNRWLFPVVVVVVVAGLVLAGSAQADMTSRLCAATKLRAAARKVAGKLACYRRAVGRGVAVDPSCLAAAEQKFDATFAAVEQRGGCATTGDAANVEATIDQLVTSLATELPATTTTTTTTTTSSTNSTAGGSCSFGKGCTGTCGGGFCTVVVPCNPFCTATTLPPSCVCSDVTYTTCTLPVCVTTTLP